MPILRIKDIRSMSPEDRRKRIVGFKTELIRLRTMIRAGGTIDDPSRIKQLRRAIAKILTIEREQQLGIKNVGKTKEVAKKPEKGAKAKSEKGKKK